MLTTIEQFAGKDIWVYAELDYEDAYIRVEKVFDDGTVWYNAWLPSDSYDKYDLDEILYGELTGDVDSIEIHPLDTLTTEELIAKIKADGKISGCSKVTSSRKFTKYSQSNSSVVATDRISLKQHIYDYLSDNRVYKALNRYEQDILTSAWSSEDPQVYLLGAIFALNSAGVSITKEFKHIIYLVTDDVNDSKKDNK